MSGIFWKRGRKNCQSDPETDKYTRCLSRIPNSTSSQKHVCTRILQNPTNLWDGDGNELCVLVNESSNLSASLMLFSFLPAPPPWRRARPICAACWKHFPEEFASMIRKVSAQIDWFFCIFVLVADQHRSSNDTKISQVWNHVRTCNSIWEHLYRKE